MGIRHILYRIGFSQPTASDWPLKPSAPRPRLFWACRRAYQKARPILHAESARKENALSIQLGFDADEALTRAHVESFIGLRFFLPVAGLYDFKEKLKKEGFHFHKFSDFLTYALFPDGWRLQGVRGDPSGVELVDPTGRRVAVIRFEIKRNSRSIAEIGAPEQS